MLFALWSAYDRPHYPAAAMPSSSENLVSPWHGFSLSIGPVLLDGVFIILSNT